MVSYYDRFVTGSRLWEKDKNPPHEGTALKLWKYFTHLEVCGKPRGQEPDSMYYQRISRRSHPAMCAFTIECGGKEFVVDYAGSVARLTRNTEIVAYQHSTTRRYHLITKEEHASIANNPHAYGYATPATIDAEVLAVIVHGKKYRKPKTK